MRTKVEEKAPQVPPAVPDQPRLLDLAAMPEPPLHPPTEPQPHLNPIEQGVHFRTVVECVLGGVLAVLLVVLALFYLT